MSITAGQVKELREKTGVGMMDCKAALSETGGDIEKAVQYLREKGLAAANKKSDRSAKEGRVFTTSTGNKGAILELNCETDFVASNEAFLELGESLVHFASENGVTDSDSLLASELNGKPVKEVIAETVLKVGENLVPGRIQLFETKGAFSEYIHSNGKIGVLVGFSGPVEEALGRDVAMHVAAAKPSYTRPEEVPTTELDSEKSVIRKQLENEGKPAQIIDKIVEGKINKYYKEICLLEQTFVKNPDKTIKALLPEGTTVESFARFELG